MVEQFERTYLQSLLTAHQGNITRAAVAAQKNRRAFFQLLRKHGIDASNFKAGE
jgi:DNA-binding NtrC family response regulator